MEYFELKIEKSIVMDDVLFNGLFNYFVLGDIVFVFCIDEVYLFLMKIISLFKFFFVNLMLECLCKCFDGDCWYVLKGNKGKCIGIFLVRVLFLVFSIFK